jgi:hypothetical protein
MSRWERRHQRRRGGPVRGGIAARTKGKVLWCVTRQDLFAPAFAQVGLAAERVIYVDAYDASARAASIPATASRTPSAGQSPQPRSDGATGAPRSQLIQRPRPLETACVTTSSCSLCLASVGLDGCSS